MSYTPMIGEEINTVAEPASDLFAPAAISSLGLAAAVVEFLLLPVVSVLDLVKAFLV